MSLLDSTGRVYTFMGGNQILERYDPSNDTWTDLASMARVTLHAGAAVDSSDDIYVASGILSGGTNAFVQCERYDASGNSWSDFTSVASGVERWKPFCWIDGSDRLHIACGILNNTDTTFRRSVYRYSGGLSGSWSDLSTDSAADHSRYFYPITPGLFDSTNRLYAIGKGDSVSTPSTDVERYDLGAGTWSTRASLPAARTWAGRCVDASDRVYVVGGTDNVGTFAPLSTTYRYDPGANSWSTLATLPIPLRSLVVLAPPDGKIYAFMGVTTGTVNNNNIYVYDPSADTWTDTGEDLTFRNGPSVVFDGTGYYFIASVSASTTVQYWTPVAQVGGRRGWATVIG
jgi:N-acetylneuraminic acid mutarotase